MAFSRMLHTTTSPAKNATTTTTTTIHDSNINNNDNIIPYPTKQKQIQRNSKDSSTSTTISPPSSSSIQVEPQEEEQEHDRRIKSMPRHIAFICDGNSRWADTKSISTTTTKTTKSKSKTSIGHAKGASRVLSTIQHLTKNHPHTVQYVTMYGFSTENWSRSNEEIQDIWKVMEDSCRTFSSWVMGEQLLSRDQIVVKVLGDLDDERIPNSLRDLLRRLEEKTKVNDEVVVVPSSSSSSSVVVGYEMEQQTGKGYTKQQQQQQQPRPLTFCVAINYGGRKDILNASLKLAELLSENKLSSQDIQNDESIIDDLLCTSGIPDPDLVIRTGGEQRLSNFLTWNCAYAELYFTDVLWPDFDDVELEKALDWYQGRDRRYGGRNSINFVKSAKNAK